jgi:hypothetical protein
MHSKEFTLLEDRCISPDRNMLIPLTKVIILLMLLIVLIKKGTEVDLQRIVIIVVKGNKVCDDFSCGLKRFFFLKKKKNIR